MKIEFKLNSEYGRKKMRNSFRRNFKTDGVSATVCLIIFALLIFGIIRMFDVMPTSIGRDISILGLAALAWFAAKISLEKFSNAFGLFGWVVPDKLICTEKSITYMYWAGRRNIFTCIFGVRKSDKNSVWQRIELCDADDDIVVGKDFVKMWTHICKARGDMFFIPNGFFAPGDRERFIQWYHEHKDKMYTAAHKDSSFKSELDIEVSAPHHSSHSHSSSGGGSWAGRSMDEIIDEAYQNEVNDGNFFH